MRHLPTFRSLLPALAAALLGSCAATAGAEAEEDDGGFLRAVAAYPVNRVVDLFDVARAGVCIGPGVGFAIVPTEAAQVALLTRSSAGVGLQTLRHPPVQAASELLVGVGPLQANPDVGAEWVRSYTDLRLDVHVALVGGYAAVEPVEIVDFVLGFVGIDLRDDDGF